ncbi:MAG: family 10 glycosylhydrolase [candidate division KSB1 bacterium]|nr:family 10 glycosylhydrolase [candidate division KSB1 bacterium]MDZ7310374.1 family 10 glycosylhydrolase [candidate division KSB1 bacterium]
MKRLALLFLMWAFNQVLLAQGNEEFRATWVITWEHISSSASPSSNQALVRTILDDHKKANMNAVLWQARQGGTAYYQSSFEPWGNYAGYKNPGYDHLAYAIQEAHARGLELHAWFNTFEAGDVVAGAPAATHPEWICRDRDGNPMTGRRALSPGLPAVRAYLVQVAMEIVRKYDIDGLHLDYVRWNEETSTTQLAKSDQEPRFSEGPISDAQINELLNNPGGRYLYDIEHPYLSGVPAGFATWEDWWRWSVTEFVRTLHDSIQAVKPWVRLSVAALGRYNWGGWNGYDVVYQDAALWLNQGYIEQIAGMHYHWTTGPEFYSLLVGGCPECWGQYIQPGIQAGRLFTVGPPSYTLAENRIWNRHPQIVQSVRTVPWADGFQFFSYGSWRDQKYWEEAKATFFQRKTKVRSIPGTPGNPPEAPAITLTKINPLNYAITVTPPASASDNQRYAIYRSPDAHFDVNADEIVDIHFGKSSYTFNDIFTGTQDFNGTYYYFATALDRFWKESAISNALPTDSIPSFAPVVIATSPAEGDTIPVNSSVVVTFSKTMQTSSLDGALSFIPPVKISQRIWSSDHKTLTIITDGSFAFATDYTLTIAPTATDINGKPLDGNGDGSGGDAFVLHFRTLAQDVTGPIIWASRPDFRFPVDDFDVDEVMTIVFDEIVKPATVNKNTVFLKEGGTDISFNFGLTTVNNKTVLSVQPLTPLKSATDYTLLLTGEITDTLGNRMATELNIAFKTSAQRYVETILIDNFLTVGNWWQPSASGSTVGIVVPNTIFGTSAEAFLPVVPGVQRRTPFLSYEWDETQSAFLIREYLYTGPPREVLFTTDYTLQCYVFGDGSNNQFRFCVDDSTKDQAAFHEVSKWITLDWYGWRLVEWKLSDPNSVGQWIGDGVLNGPSLRFDSFQLTHTKGAAVRGKIFLDNLRLVKKSTEPVGVAERRQALLEQFALYQNYPNPFNPITKIAFDLPAAGLVQLVIYDFLGREVMTLLNAQKAAGRHEVQLDASALPSGLYYYRLNFAGQSLTRKLMVLK